MDVQKLKQAEMNDEHHMKREIKGNQTMRNCHIVFVALVCLMILEQVL